MELCKQLGSARLSVVFLPLTPGAPPVQHARPGKVRPPNKLLCKIKVRPRSYRSYPGKKEV